MAGIFDRVISTNGDNPHQVWEETLEVTATYSVHNIYMEGDYDSLKGIINTNYCNKIVTGLDTWLYDFPGCKSDCVITHMSLSRKEGARGRAVFTVKQFQRGYVASIDFDQITRDIKFWRAYCTKDKPSMDAIRFWLSMKEREEWLEYYNKGQFVVPAMPDGKKLQIGIPQDNANGVTYKEFEQGDVVSLEETEDSSGAGGQVVKALGSPVTGVLAYMIYKYGVESFPEYVPSLNITYTLAAHPTVLGVKNFMPGAYLGCIIPDNMLVLGDSGFDRPIGTIQSTPSPVSDFIRMYEGKNLCTTDQLRCNSDGSYTLTRGFLKFRNIAPELYVNGGGVYGPYDVNELPK